MVVEDHWERVEEFLNDLGSRQKVKYETTLVPHPESLVLSYEPWYSYWWETEAGYTGVVLRSPVTGSLCGYVSLEDDYPDKSSYDEFRSNNFNVHGGLTFFGEVVLKKSNLSFNRCLGFDTAHAHDLCPNVPSSVGMYRDFPYVANEVESLSWQLQHRFVQVP